MNYTDEQVEEILINVWNDRVKGGGWDTRENFINHFKQVKKLNIDDVSNSFKKGYCKLSCIPSDWHKDGKCGKNGCWHK